MLRTPMTDFPPSASVADSRRNSETSRQSSRRYASRTIFSHSFLAVGAFLLYLLLNRPEVVLLSKLGMTAWYPAAGLAFAVMLVISPRYMPVFWVANALAGVLIYNQAFYSWDTIVGAPLETGAYAIAAYFLRGDMEVEDLLCQRRGVLRYVVATSAAAIFSTLAGVTCLLADHTIQWSQFWDSAMAWYFGDAIALLSVAPFLFIHIFPWVSRQIVPATSENKQPGEKSRNKISANTPLKMLEIAGHVAAFVVVFWFMFRGSGSQQLFYLAFLPIIWIAMRQGIRGAVTGLLVLNFGIVASLRLVSVPPEVFTKLGFLMLAVSSSGLILGSAVTERRRIANELGERTVFLNSLIEYSPFGIVVNDCNDKIQLSNSAFADLFLFSGAEILGQNLLDLIVPADMRSEAKELSQQLASGKTVQSTVRRFRKDGHPVDVEIHATPMVRDGQIQGSYVIYKDISEQVKAFIAAKEQEEVMNRWIGELQMRTMQITLLNEMGGLLQCVESSEEAYAVLSQSARKLFFGTRSGALFILKSSRDSLERKTSWGNRDDGQLAFAPNDCWSLRLGQPHWSDCPGQGVVCAHVDSSTEANHLCVPLVAHGETLGIIHIECDPDRGGTNAEADQNARESQKRLAVAAAGQIALALANLRLRETLRDQSIRDSLTGLFNRRFMQETLEKELKRAKRKQRSVSLVFLDLDHFKHFNDIFGHDAGDTVLRSLAELFRASFRADDVICRYGGEEFAVILPESCVQDAAKRAEELRMATKELKLVHRGVALDPITVSIGVAGFPDHGQDAQELLERADQCLYQSKANGRDRVTQARQQT